MAKQGKQQGVALITVLLIVSLAAIITTEMTGRLQLQLQRDQNIAMNQQAYWYAMGAEAFAKLVLKNTVVKDGKTNLSQPWAQGKQTFPVDYGQISGEITDLHSCFNLNALAVKPKRQEQARNVASARQSFVDLVVALEIEDIGEFEAEGMADALTDWLDKDTELSGLGGAEDNDYAAKLFPYLPANQLLASINELRAIESFTPQVIVALKPHVCIIPELNTQKVNVNTLAKDRPVLLQGLLGITKTAAEEILSAIPSEGFEDIKEFTELPEIKKHKKITKAHLQVFVVDSEYFQLKAETNFIDSNFWLTSVFKIEQNKRISVISRRIGRD